MPPGPRFVREAISPRDSASSAFSPHPRVASRTSELAPAARGNRPSRKRLRRPPCRRVPECSRPNRFACRTMVPSTGNSTVRVDPSASIRSRWTTTPAAATPSSRTPSPSSVQSIHFVTSKSEVVASIAGQAPTGGPATAASSGPGLADEHPTMQAMMTGAATAIRRAENKSRRDDSLIWNHHSCFRALERRHTTEKRGLWFRCNFRCKPGPTAPLHP